MPDRAAEPARKSAAETVAIGDVATGRPMDEDARFADCVVLMDLLSEDAVSEFARRPRADSLAVTLVNAGLITEQDRLAAERLSSASWLLELRRESADETRSFTPSGVRARVVRPEVIGDYELIAEIGKGGQGCVYKARQRSLNRLVALKLIRAWGQADREQVARFYAEARAAGRLDHPGIVPVFDVGESEGRHFYSMALIEGVSLSAKVKEQGPLPPAEAATLMRAIADAVSFAHQQGIIHRDIKPHNILLDGAGQPRVADFGLARHAGSDWTVDGEILGTPSYMPPEQAAGRIDDVGPASDVYSLGATLYYLLIGRPPFQASSATETIRQVIDHDPVPPRRLNAALDRDLETICLKCLRKEPNSRYATAKELSADLARWLAKEPISARRFSVFERARLWTRRNRQATAAIGAVVAILLLAGVILGVQRQRTYSQLAAAKAANDRTRTESLVESVLNAPPTALPYAVPPLEQLADYARPLLRERFQSADRETVQARHAALALAALGELDAEYLISAVPAAGDDECANLIAALRRDTATSLRLLEQQAAPPDSAADDARLAVLALYLGDGRRAARICERQSNPAPHAILVQTLARWHGDLVRLAEIARAQTNAPVRAAICLAIGETPAKELTPAAKQAWQTLAGDWYRQASDRETHSAAGWLLRKWRVPLPALDSPSSEPRGWQVTSQGLTLIAIPAGSFRRTVGAPGATREQTVTISKPFWIADREISNELMRRFLTDKDYPEEDRPKDCQAAADTGEAARELPTNLVRRQDVAMFCNWLSAREQLPPSYRRNGENWERIADSPGYRLPTEAEWEYAARGGIDTRYLSGEKDGLLAHYAVFRTAAAEPCGGRLPNRLGLFDVCGNVLELCEDRWGSHDAEGDSVTDPAGPTAGLDIVVRGGSYRNGAEGMRLFHRTFSHPQTPLNEAGFRVVRRRADLGP